MVQIQISLGIDSFIINIIRVHLVPNKYQHSGTISKDC